MNMINIRLDSTFICKLHDGCVFFIRKMFRFDHSRALHNIQIIYFDVYSAFVRLVVFFEVFTIHGAGNSSTYFSPFSRKHVWMLYAWHIIKQYTSASMEWTKLNERKEREKWVKTRIKDEKPWQKLNYPTKNMHNSVYWKEKPRNKTTEILNIVYRPCVVVYTLNKRMHTQHFIW